MKPLCDACERDVRALDAALGLGAFAATSASATSASATSASEATRREGDGAGGTATAATATATASPRFRASSRLRLVPVRPRSRRELHSFRALLSPGLRLLRPPRALPAGRSSVDAFGEATDDDDDDDDDDDAASPEPLLIVVECDGVLCDVHLDGHREAFNEVRPISRRSPYDPVRVVNAIP